MDTSQIFIVIGIILLIIEIFIPSFIAGSLSIGFFLAALGAYLKLDIKWQILMFSSGVLLALFTVRPLMLKYGYRAGKHIKTNQEALTGRTGKVIEAIDNSLETGRVAIDGDIWRSKSFDGSLIPINSLVEVIEIQSIIIIVKLLK